MIYSMTGFGKASRQLPTKKITIEIKSLNSKNMDLYVRMPHLYKEKELEFRTHIAKKLERGKVECYLMIESTGAETSTSINTPVVQQYMQQLREIVPTITDKESLALAVKMPDALTTISEDLDEDEWATILELLDEALENIENFRRQEGKKMEEDFKLRIHNIGEGLSSIAPFEADRIEKVKERLAKNLEELQVNVDEQRFAQEVVYYLEKLDINEEKVRLKNHLDYFIETIESPENTGRKLGFIAQEMGREINTLGSKSNQKDMQQIVVQMKDELEKIKEQVLNIL